MFCIIDGQVQERCHTTDYDSDCSNVKGECQENLIAALLVKILVDVVADWNESKSVN